MLHILNTLSPVFYPFHHSFPTNSYLLDPFHHPLNTISPLFYHQFTNISPLTYNSFPTFKYFFNTFTAVLYLSYFYFS